MAIEKIGNQDNIVNMNIKMEATKRQTPQSDTQVESVTFEKSVPTEDLTSITYPPFFPLGDTQGIFKIKK